MLHPCANDSGWIAEIIAQQKKLFREQFGRKPGPDDSLFFEPSVAVPQFLSDESTDVILRSEDDSRLADEFVRASLFN